MAFEVSNIVQEIYEDILSDHTFIKDYLALNSKLIQESYVLLTTGLNKLKIPFFHCHAGIFLFVNMSHLLKGKLINTSTTSTLTTILNILSILQSDIIHFYRFFYYFMIEKTFDAEQELYQTLGKSCTLFSFFQISIYSLIIPIFLSIIYIFKLSTYPSL